MKKLIEAVHKVRLNESEELGEGTQRTIRNFASDWISRKRKVAQC